MNITLHGPVAVELHPGDVQWIEHPTPGAKIGCENGIVWLTQAGKCGDQILMPGDMYVALVGGKLLIQALRDAVVHIA